MKQGSKCRSGAPAPRHLFGARSAPQHPSSTSAPVQHPSLFLGAGCQHLPPWCEGEMINQILIYGLIVIYLCRILKEQQIKLTEL